MIARLTGVLVSVTDDTVLVDCQGIGYEVLIPPASQPALAAMRDAPVTLHTLHYLEGGLGGGNPVPRLAGFLTEIEREFAQRFITVKGIGVKAVLKALTVPVHDIARAIEQKDIRALVQLPGIGKRSAEQIIAELNGKVGKYALLRGAPAEQIAPAAAPLVATEVLTILEHLGYSAVEADGMWAKVAHEAFDTAEDAMQAIFRQETGAPA